MSFRPPMETFWTLATRNFPVTRGESFWTGNAGRTELQLGGVEARVDSQTELDVLDLDYGETRLALTQGSVDLRIWRAPRGGVRISTPAGRVFFGRAGVYRIDVAAPDENGGYAPVEVTVFNGAAEVPGPDGLIRVDAGEAAVIYPGDLPEAVDVEDASIDDWARDGETRERRARDEAIDVPGYADLGDQGEFVQKRGIRDLLVPHHGPRRLGALSFRSLGLCAAVGLDLDRRPGLGFCPLSLRTLGAD